MISEKQRKILAFPYSDYDALICDGAVRSGKTSIMTVAFVDWAMRRFSGQRFGVCGRTVDSCTKNIILPYLAMRYAQDRYSLTWRRADKTLEVRRGAVCNVFEVFGGKDESSFALIQGRTLAGVLLDEVVLMPRSFVEQALTRCSVDGAKLWFSCNPGSPQHWFYTDWIRRCRERNALYLHFEMADNPGLSPKTLARYQTMFSGVFYDRYVRGLWVLAEGLVYPMFGEACLTDERPESGEYYISCDYGTLNRTDEEYYVELERLAGEHPVRGVIVDPSAASFIEVIRRHRRFPVRKARNDVLPGILTTARYLQTGVIRIHRDCEAARREFGLYRWDEKAAEDRPIKENDHAMDDIRYFAYTVLREKADRPKYTPIWNKE